MYLVDTNILSLFAPGRQRGGMEEAIAVWLHDMTDSLHLSVVTLSEIETGIAQLKRNGATAKAQALSEWLEQVVDLHASRIHLLGIDAARLAGQLYDRAIGNGHKPSYADAAIAATAQISDLKIVTRNASHFTHFGVAFFNPYDGLP